MRTLLTVNGSSDGPLGTPWLLGVLLYHVPWGPIDVGCIVACKHLRYGKGPGLVTGASLISG